MCAIKQIWLGKYGGQSKGCGPSPNVSLSESSRESGDDYREKPEGRGARQRERGTGARRTGSTLDTHQLYSWWEEGTTPQGMAKETGSSRAHTGESGTLGSKVGLYTNTETHNPTYH